MENLYARVAAAVAEGQSVALATLVRVEGSTPRELGSKMLVYADGQIAGTIGGGAMEAAVIDAAAEALAQGEPRLLRYELRDPAEGDLGICGGEAEVFIDVIAPRPTCSWSARDTWPCRWPRLGHQCGFRVVVLDDRPDMVSEERFPHAAERISGDIAAQLSEMDLTSQWYVVIVTRGHAYDEEALRTVVGSQAAYVGMIGSRRKVRTTLIGCWPMACPHRCWNGCTRRSASTSARRRRPRSRSASWPRSFGCARARAARSAAQLARFDEDRVLSPLPRNRRA